MRASSVNRLLRAAAIASLATAAATALIVHGRARAAERRHPPEGRFVEVDGVRLHYRESGTGQPVVLLHGNGATSADFVITGVVNRVAAGHRVLAFDRPGYGYSQRPRGRAWTPIHQADFFASVFAALGLERPIVVGHSWGALVTAALALRHPRAVRGIVLVAGYFFPTRRIDVRLLSAFAIPVIGDLVRYTVLPFVARRVFPKMAQRIFAPAPVPASFNAIMLDMALRPSQLRASAEETASMVPAARALGPHYRLLQVPTLILTGSKDQIVDPQLHSLRLHRTVSHSRLDVVEGGGHMLHFEVPGRIVAAIDLVVVTTEDRVDVSAPRGIAAALA